MLPAPRSHHEAVFAVATAITIGATLLGAAHSVGAYREATVAELRFGALDRRGAVLLSIETEEHATGLYTVATTERQDWSAAGAARAFVLAEGVQGAVTALRKAGLVAGPRPKAKQKSPLDRVVALGQRVSFVIERGR
jgi:hypothetical protein